MSLLWTALITAQTTSDFESLLSSPESFLNGSDGSGGWEDGNIFINNSYNAAYDSWTGWAISNITDTLTAGYTNQYSCIAGEGVNGSESYAVAFTTGETLMSTVNEGQGGVMEGFYINNSTYAFLSMRDGDSFSKKFGGEDGTDPDFFYLTIKEHGSRNILNDSINIFLADYRSDNPSDDYILNEWTFVDLSRFENVDTLSFVMHSSDVGMFGINTPQYFCIDDVTTTDVVLTSTTDISLSLALHPNPALSYISVAHPDTAYELRSMTGVKVAEGLTDNQGQISVTGLASGYYVVRLRLEEGFSTGSFYKQ